MLQLLTYQQTVGVLFIVLSAMGNDVVYFMVILLCLEPQPQTQHRQPPAPYPQPNPYSYSNPYPHLHPWYQVIFLVLTVGFGVSFAVLLPNAMSEPWYRVMGNNPLWGPFWGVFGSFDVSGPLALEKATAEGGGVLVEQLEPTTTLTPILLWVYQFVAAIILINLLIAQMADTYGRVTADGLVRWQFERAALISEYKDTKPPLPPPVNLLCVLGNLLRGLLSKACAEGDAPSTPGFQTIPDTMQVCARLEPCPEPAPEPAPDPGLRKARTLTLSLTPRSCASSSGARTRRSRSACASAPRGRRRRPRPRRRSSGWR